MQRVNEDMHDVATKRTFRDAIDTQVVGSNTAYSETDCQTLHMNESMGLVSGSVALENVIQDTNKQPHRRQVSEHKRIKDQIRPNSSKIILQANAKIIAPKTVSTSMDKFDNAVSKSQDLKSVAQHNKIYSNPTI